MRNHATPQEEHEAESLAVKSVAAMLSKELGVEVSPECLVDYMRSIEWLDPKHSPIEGAHDHGLLRVDVSGELRITNRGVDNLIDRLKAQQESAA